MLAPTSTWYAAPPSRPARSSEGPWPFSRGGIRSAITKDSAALTRAGTARLENGGAIAKKADSRTVAISRVARVSPATRVSIRPSLSARAGGRPSVEQLREHGEQVAGEADRLLQHPVTRDEQD